MSNNEYNLGSFCNEQAEYSFTKLLLGTLSQACCQ